MGRQRQQESANELRVSHPQGTLRITFFKGKHVNEDWMRPPEQNIQRRSILQDPTVRERLLAQVERQGGGGSPLPRCPLPWIGWERNPFVLEQRRRRMCLATPARLTQN
jgi:hypothetical protein